MRRLVFPLLLVLVRTAAAAEPVSFGRDVLPLLSDRCLLCHGPDEGTREADLRLDTREGATAGGAVVPGDPDASELIARVTTDDPDLAMPPAAAHKKPFTAEEVALLRRWIAEGAAWGGHWAFEPPSRREPSNPAANPVDGFVRDRLAKEGLTLSPPAPRHTQLRRLSFDLTGLPPTVEEIDAFLSDPSPDAYERQVDRLLASERFGERMAMWWLDAARYSDTDGYQQDATRTNWPWRDWVVAAFNANKPFDEFTVEQFAGDLLPDATPEQRLATCFHRNHMTNGEGGRDPEESRIDYVIDRVNTTGTVWLGLTLGCAQCHSHKYDPVSQADYYSLAAFFDSIDEDGKAGKAAKPYLAYKSPLAAPAVAEAERLVAERKPLEARARREAEGPFAAWLAERVAEARGGYVAWTPLTDELASTEGTRLVPETDGVVRADGPNPNQDDYRVAGPVSLRRVTGVRLEVLPHPSHTNGGLSRGATGEFVLTDIKLQARRRGGVEVRDLAAAGAVADVSADKAKNGGYGPVADTLDDDPRNGWTTKGADPTAPHVAVFELAEPFVPEPDEEFVVELRHRSTLGDANIGRFRVSLTDQPGAAVRSVEPTPLERLAAAGIRDPAAVPADLRAALFEQFLADHAPYVAAKAALDRANRQLAETKAAVGPVDVMVLAERAEPRDTHVLVRGVWDKKGEKVGRGVPAAVAAWPEGAERTRLGLARWLVSRDNPLTARVIVNQAWQLFFGAGLVRTPEDFGLQGERPTHPELLDRLAVDFMEGGWDLKALVRTIVTSDVYRQNSAVSPGLVARDPENRLLARGARFRLPSWMIRDAALRASGLMNPAVGGPPVRPYQPEGVWEEIFMGRFRYEPSEGPAQHRRTLYAFWRRSIAPTFLFDAAQRRVCEVGASRTNTPLHALTLLNDETFLEASRAVAAHAMADTADAPGRLDAICRRILSRPPTEPEAAVLRRELDRSLARFRARPDEAARFLAVGQGPPDVALDPADLAAHMLVASLVFNLDEAITHE